MSETLDSIKQPKFIDVKRALDTLLHCDPPPSEAVYKRTVKSINAARGRMSYAQRQNVNLFSFASSLHPFCVPTVAASSKIQRQEALPLLHNALAVSRLESFIVVGKTTMLPLATVMVEDSLSVVCKQELCALFETQVTQLQFGIVLPYSAQAEAIRADHTAMAELASVLCAISDRIYGFTEDAKRAEAYTKRVTPLLKAALSNQKLTCPVERGEDERVCDDESEGDESDEEQPEPASKRRCQESGQNIDLHGVELISVPRHLDAIRKTDFSGPKLRLDVLL